ncbi:MAG TPA: sensor histidine kinase [Lachnospiraceae bacterium]|nr:sensor histidine kinase [Lachnospiraceae bacterium]HCR99487.1 sensor histidine kinase [Lachnospiraceae bacterium]
MRKKSIHIILLRALLLLSVLTLVLISLIFSIMQYRTLKNHATRDMRANCTAIAANLEQKLKEMDTILMYSIASSELKESFTRYMEAGDSFEKLRARQELGGIMISLKGFNFSNRQFNIYDTESGGYGVGNYNGVLTESVRDLPWYEKTEEYAGKKYIYAPAMDVRASKHAGVDEETLYFSLCRLFYGDYHYPMGFMEVKAYYNEIFGPLGNQVSTLKPVIAVYDGEGRQIYPEEAVFPYYNYRERSYGEILNTYTGRKQYLCFAEDESDKLTVAMAVDDAVFMGPVYRAFIPAVCAVILILIFSVILSAALSRQMSDPIRRIYAFLSDTDREQYARLKLQDSGVLEIDKLRDSINESIRSQESSTQTMLTLKEQEMQAQMLALQSQMNPHFLYNSLTMIGEMAESGMTDQVSEMCEDITSILRYISSNREMRIRVEEEMEQVDRYLGCMKRRFGNGLTYTYEISDDILDCMVPKLCIQLLVENAVKAVMVHREPWEIRVEGGMKGEDWHVTVMDNGPGFDPEVDRELRKSMDSILESGLLPSLKIEGMGILNIFIRLYLLDGIPFVFDFGNREEGGAFVTVGGHVKSTGEGNDQDRPL